MPTPTNRYVNTPSVVFTPNGGSATPITGIKSVSTNLGLNWIKDAGDGDIAPTTVVNDYVDPVIEFTTTDAFALYASLVGTIGTLVIKFADAKNGVAVGGGGKQVTLSNAFLQTESRSAPYRQFATQNMAFGSYSSDGQTIPAAVAAL